MGKRLKAFAVAAAVTSDEAFIKPPYCRKYNMGRVMLNTIWKPEDHTMHSLIIFGIETVKEILHTMFYVKIFCVVLVEHVPDYLLLEVSLFLLILQFHRTAVKYFALVWAKLF